MQSGVFSHVNVVIMKLLQVETRGGSRPLETVTDDFWIM